MMKESKVVNNINTHSYTQAEVNVMVMQIHAKEVINFFGKRAILAMIK